MPMTEKTEFQLINVVRNALLVAGMEMGAQGDHWPVIKSTVHSIMKDWEDLQVERNVAGEMKKHLYEQLAIMERGMADCDATTRAEVEPKLKELREVYDAYFSAVIETGPVDLNSPDMPLYVKRAQTIIDTLESGHE